MKYLLDTNICIFLIKSTTKEIVKKIETCKLGDIGVSSISVAELKHGVYKSRAIEQNSKALEQFLMPLAIVDFDYQAATAYGVIRTQLEKSGTIIGPLDTLIAAQAIAASLILVTNNVREFKRVANLAIEDWT